MWSKKSGSAPNWRLSCLGLNARPNIVVNSERNRSQRKSRMSSPKVTLRVRARVSRSQSGPDVSHKSCNPSVNAILKVMTEPMKRWSDFALSQSLAMSRDVWRWDRWRESPKPTQMDWALSREQNFQKGIKWINVCQSWVVCSAPVL